MAKPMTFPHSSVLRLTGEQRERVEEERKQEDKIPAFAEMVRTLIDEALTARQVDREMSAGLPSADEMLKAIGDTETPA